MAILNGIIKKMTGSAGQQRQRMKWVNIIRMYSGIVLCCALPSLDYSLDGNGTISLQEAIEKTEREFEIYREWEMRQLESDFDKAVKRLTNKKDKDDEKTET